MGRIIVSTALSLDGRESGPGGDVTVMPLDEGFNEHNARLIRDAATLLYGATTFGGMLSYWPAALDDPSASPATTQIARRMADGMPVVVVSDALTDEDAGVWRDQTTVVRRADAHRAVADLREAEGDTVIFGSRTVWTDLMAHGLVDELFVLVGPSIVGGDVHAFDGVPAGPVRLLDVRRLDDSDLVALHYATS